jgi:hypothetical protein
MNAHEMKQHLDAEQRILVLQRRRRIVKELVEGRERRRAGHDERVRQRLEAARSASRVE